MSEIEGITGDEELSEDELQDEEINIKGSKTKITEEVEFNIKEKGRIHHQRRKTRRKRRRKHPKTMHQTRRTHRCNI